MRNGKEYLILLAAAGMESAWLLAIPAFLFAAGHWPLLPLPDQLGIVGLAVLTTTFTLGRGWLLLAVGALQAVGLTGSVLYLEYSYGHWPEPFFSLAWVREMGAGLTGPTEWFLFVLVALCGILLWWGGFALARRNRSYGNLSMRFDLGLGIFFFLFLIGAGSGVTHPLIRLLILPFFFSGMLAIALARTRGSGEKSFLSGYRGLGLILTFAGLVIVSGALIAAFLLPYLTIAAEAGYRVLRAAAVPFAPLLLRFIAFLAGARIKPNILEDPGATFGGSDQAPDLAGSHGPEGWLDQIFAWGFWGIGGILGAAVIGWGLWNLFLLLRKRTAKNPERGRPAGRWFSWLKGLVLIGKHLWAVCLRLLRRDRTHDGSPARRHFLRLVKWGQSGGRPRRRSETPAEYGCRLGEEFPDLNEEIGLIISSFNQETYGGRQIRRSELPALGAAGRKIIGTRPWRNKLKTRFLS